jgi:hypothetical protein
MSSHSLMQNFSVNRLQAISLKGLNNNHNHHHHHHNNQAEHNILRIRQSDIDNGPILLDNHENYTVIIEENLYYGLDWNNEEKRYLWSAGLNPPLNNTDYRYLRMPISGWGAMIYVLSNNVTIRLNGYTLTLAENAPMEAFAGWNAIVVGNQYFADLRFPLSAGLLPLLGGNVVLRDIEDRLLFSPILKISNFTLDGGGGKLEGTHACIVGTQSNNIKIFNVVVAGNVQGIFFTNSSNVLVENVEFTTFKMIKSINLSSVKCYYTVQYIRFALDVIKLRQDITYYYDSFGNEYTSNEILFNTNFNEASPISHWLMNVVNSPLYAFRFSRFNLLEQNVLGAPVYDAIANNIESLSTNIDLNNTSINRVIGANNGPVMQNFVYTTRSSSPGPPFDSTNNLGGVGFFSTFSVKSLFGTGDNWDKVTENKILLAIEKANAKLAFYFPTFMSKNTLGFPTIAAVRSYGMQQLSSGKIFEPGNESLLNQFPNITNFNVGTQELTSYSIMKLESGQSINRLLDVFKFEYEVAINAGTSLDATVRSLSIEGNRNVAPQLQGWMFMGTVNTKLHNSSTSQILSLNSTELNLDEFITTLTNLDETLRVAAKTNDTSRFDKIFNAIINQEDYTDETGTFSGTFFEKMMNVNQIQTIPNVNLFNIKFATIAEEVQQGNANFIDSVSNIVNEKRTFSNMIIGLNLIAASLSSIKNFLVRGVYQYNTSVPTVATVDTWRLENRDENGTFPLTPTPNGKLVSYSPPSDGLCIKNRSIIRPVSTTIQNLFDPSSATPNSIPLPATSEYILGDINNPAFQNFINYFLIPP